MDLSLILVHTINHDGSSSPNIVDALLCELLHSSRLDNDIESIRIIFLQLLPLGSRVLPIEFDVFIASLELFRDIHLDTFVSGNSDFMCSVEF